MKPLRYLVPCFLLSSCCSLNDDWYFRGDGTLRNRACWPFENYVVDLGTIDLTERTLQTREFSGLPRMEWSVGFLIPRPMTDPVCPEIQKQGWTTVVLEVDLSEVGGKAVFHHIAPLREWTWTYGGKGDDPECQVYSRRSYFEPRDSFTRYRLSYRVVQPNSSSPTVRADMRTFAVYGP